MLEDGILEEVIFTSSCLFGIVLGCKDEGMPRELGRLLVGIIDAAPLFDVVPDGACILDP